MKSSSVLLLVVCIIFKIHLCVKMSSHFVFCILFISTCFVWRFAQNAHVSVYAHDFYKGHREEYTLGMGCTRLVALGKTISSIRIHSGCVKLCQRRDCRNCQDVYQDAPTLRMLDINDAVQSIKRCRNVEKSRMMVDELMNSDEYNSMMNVGPENLQEPLDNSIDVDYY